MSRIGREEVETGKLRQEGVYGPPPSRLMPLQVARLGLTTATGLGWEGRCAPESRAWASGCSCGQMPRPFLGWVALARGKQV